MGVSKVMQLAWVLTAASSPALASVDGWRDIRTITGFQGWRAELQRAVDQDGHARVNHFCIVVRIARGQDGPDNKAFVYWREEHSIQAYGQTKYPMSPLTESGGDYVDLRNDVVASERQINGSVSRVTRAYVDNILTQCRRVGISVVVVKHDRQGAGR